MSAGNPALNRIVLAATLVAALTFAVMIGAFYIAEQYLQRVAGSRRWAPPARSCSWRCWSARPRRWPAGSSIATASGCPRWPGSWPPASAWRCWGSPACTLDGVVTIAAADPGRAWGWGCCSCPPAGPRSTPARSASHGRTSALLSVGRLLGAAVGAGLAGIALAGNADGLDRSPTLLLGAIVCLAVGIPASTLLTVGGAGPELAAG